MPKEEWGVKRVCPETGKRFYDLQANPIVSPYTGTEYPLSFFTQDKSKTTMADKEDQSAIKKAKEEEQAEETDVLDDDSGDDDATDVNLGDDVLEEDDDDTVNLEEIADVPADSSDDS
ncbi:MAG: TIGR02300 family protein [Rhodobacteraceae bacterium]|nr:TIGR02300 family protein [Paracoccaceae bacterium]